MRGKNELNPNETCNVCTYELYINEIKFFRIPKNPLEVLTYNI